MVKALNAPGAPFENRRLLRNWIGAMRKLLKISAILTTIILLVSCAPEVGSEAWCEDMKEKPKGDWTGSEAIDFAKHCVL